MSMFQHESRTRPALAIRNNSIRSGPNTLFRASGVRDYDEYLELNAE